MKKNKIFVIAEAGINHNGRIHLAKKLIDAAKKAGADAVKFQIFKTQNVITREAKLSNYQKKSKGGKKINSLYSLLKKLELKYQDFKILYNYCRKKKIEFMCTADEPEGFHKINALVKKIKIGSAELNDHFFLGKIAKLNKTTFLSTGLSNLKEINESVKVLKKNGLSKEKIFLLHCNSSYPTPDRDVNLNVLRTYKNKFGNNIGLSDHSPKIIASVLSVAFGAKVIEKHITLSKKLIGPDHSSSLDPSEFAEMVNLIRQSENMIGSKIKKITPSEKINFVNIRKGIYAKKDILKGESFTLENLCIKRPYNGTDIRKFKKIIGKKSRKNYKSDQSVHHL
tara:strand:+ start:13644 stop:14660 length:1017 start_codon:yes stop_codon:yes gene_type:complete